MFKKTITTIPATSDSGMLCDDCQFDGHEILRREKGQITKVRYCNFYKEFHDAAKPLFCKVELIEVTEGESPGPFMIDDRETEKALRMKIKTLRNALENAICERCCCANCDLWRGEKALRGLCIQYGTTTKWSYLCDDNWKIKKKKYYNKDCEPIEDEKMTVTTLEIHELCHDLLYVHGIHGKIHVEIESEIATWLEKKGLKIIT